MSFRSRVAHARTTRGILTFAAPLQLREVPEIEYFPFLFPFLSQPDIGFDAPCAVDLLLSRFGPLIRPVLQDVVRPFTVRLPGLRVC